jgi:hypothetical protein
VSRQRLINILLFITFLFGYMEWGRGNHTFIFQAQAEMLIKASTDIRNLVHPFIIVPFVGQVLILWSIFQKEPGRRITFIGLACLSTIMLFLFFIGVSAPNFKILGSTLPFLVTAILALRYHRKGKLA